MHARSSVNLNWIEWISLVLVVVGALNWGLVGIQGFIGGNLNLVNLLLGSVPILEAIVYLLVGLAGLYVAYMGVQLFGARRTRTGAPADPTE